MSKSTGKGGPNKTVAAARKRMGGFPARERSPERDPQNDPFMAWIFDKARAGFSFATIDEARAAFEAENGWGFLMTTKCPDDQCDEDCCPDGECEMHRYDDSYDDEFGTVRIAPYLQCNVCNRTEALS